MKRVLFSQVFPKDKDIQIIDDGEDEDDEEDSHDQRVHFGLIEEAEIQDDQQR